MNSVLALNPYTAEDYLATEALADFKSEYYAGEVFPMAGGSINHNRITGNVHFALKLALKGLPFEVFASDLKLHTPGFESFTYPDVMVIKDPPAYWQDRRDTVCSAVLVVEVLSDSTKDYDRSDKFAIYRQLAELQDYILISQDKIHVEHYSRKAPQQWLMTEYTSLEAVLTVTALATDLALSDLYDKVAL
ncbi:Uma2 family endonuclease [Methylovulum psychrotolerans]|uniref:Uma2 family endonuclease n=1 Tax=Methylovulum psychrotolerans TaxID=1704499 RepID=UPI001BFF02FC|nr:Uma2 family endonuclease [Methylovulum psychrotolerans]MBT9099929.1 Uma2 family endonuclease [Methylovulum psychrotolerans]